MTGLSAKPSTDLTRLVPQPPTYPKRGRPDAPVTPLIEGVDGYPQVRSHLVYCPQWL
jgi:hypothetical protein